MGIRCIRIIVMQLKPTSKRKRFTRRGGISSGVKAKIVRVIRLTILLKNFVLRTCDRIITIRRVTVRTNINNANVI